eukprot:8279205-Heterocapsa_arctica.AAC.1
MAVCKILSKAFFRSSSTQKKVCFHSLARSPTVKTIWDASEMHLPGKKAHWFGNAKGSTNGSKR